MGINALSCVPMYIHKYKCKNTYHINVKNEGY